MSDMGKTANTHLGVDEMSNKQITIFKRLILLQRKHLSRQLMIKLVFSTGFLKLTKKKLYDSASDDDKSSDSDSEDSDDDSDSEESDSEDSDDDSDDSFFERFGFHDATFARTSCKRTLNCCKHTFLPEIYLSLLQSPWFMYNMFYGGFCVLNSRNECRSWNTTAGRCYGGRDAEE